MRKYRPCFDKLDDRLNTAVFTGGGADLVNHSGIKDWNDPANWDGNDVPDNAGEDAGIISGNVGIDINTTIGMLTASSTSISVFNATFSVTGGPFPQISELYCSTITSQGGTVNIIDPELNGSGFYALDPNGGTDVTLGAFNLGGSSGRIRGSSVNFDAVVTQAGGAMSIETDVFLSGTYYNYGTVALKNNRDNFIASLTGSGRFTNNDTLTVNVYGDNTNWINIVPDYVNNGTVNLLSGFLSKNNNGAIFSQTWDSIPAGPPFEGLLTVTAGTGCAANAEVRVDWQYDDDPMDEIPPVTGGWNDDLTDGEYSDQRAYAGYEWLHRFTILVRNAGGDGLGSFVVFHVYID